MSAPVVRVPTPRRPVEPVAPFAEPLGPQHRVDVPAPRTTPGGSAGTTRHPVPRPGTGRHRDTAPAFPAAARTLTVLARAGSLTTLAAMVVLAAAVAGLADGTPPAGAAAGITADGLHP